MTEELGHCYFNPYLLRCIMPHSWLRTSALWWNVLNRSPAEGQGHYPSRMPSHSLAPTVTDWISFGHKLRLTISVWVPVYIYSRIMPTHFQFNPHIAAFTFTQVGILIWPQIPIQIKQDWLQKVICSHERPPDFKIYYSGQKSEIETFI